ncbi:hypothetical protein DPEC_G00236460 [Dallia pectoralis]|uniref:Uncharacterized protein n=1 Tax=Dallia pectoralis TaxID=75939 RepID=A0ACC2FYS4_DALPE|nr:hypothetical protein DPEC_G00236460 [Dallia pectoralis]
MIAESEKEQEDWCLALNELMIEEKKEYQDADDLDDGYWTLSPGTIFKEVWQVIVKAKGLGQTKNMVGVCRLCLSSKTIRLVKASVDTPSVNLPLVSIRRCGHSESFFFIEMGRSSSTGPGEIWMQVDSGDPLQAQNIHETILEAMRALRAIPDFRQRSASQSYPSNPYAAVLTRRHPHGNLPPSQTGLWCTSKAGSVREQSSKKREECMSIASDSGRSIDKHPWHPDTSTCSSPSDRGSVNFEVLDSKSCIFQVSNVNTTATPCNTTPLEENSQGERFKAEKSTPERSRGHNRNTLYTPKCETFLSSKASTLRCQSELAVEDGYMPMTPGLVPNGSDGTPSEVGLPNTPPITPDATSLPVDPAKPHEYMSMFPRSSSKAKDRLREIDPSPSDEYVTMSLRSTVEDFSGGSSEDLKSCRSSCTPPTTRHDPLQKNSECDDYVPMCHFVGHALKGTRRRLFRSSPWPTSHLNTDVGLDTSNVCLFAVAGLSVEGGQLTKTKLISNSSDCLNNNAVNPGHCVTCDARWPTGDATSHLGSSRHQRSCPETYGVSELCDSTGQNTATRRWIHSCFPFCLNTDDDSE